MRQRGKAKGWLPWKKSQELRRSYEIEWLGNDCVGEVLIRGLKYRLVRWSDLDSYGQEFVKRRRDFRHAAARERLSAAVG